MIPLLILAIGLLLAVAVLAYLLGFRLGGGGYASEAMRIRAEAMRAQRDLHGLTRSAFIAMAEEAERRGNVHDPFPGD